MTQLNNCVSAKYVREIPLCCSRSSNQFTLQVTGLGMWPLQVVWRTCSAAQGTPVLGMLLGEGSDSAVA